MAGLAAARHDVSAGMFLTFAISAHELSHVGYRPLGTRATFHIIFWP